MKIWAVTLVGMASVFVPSALWGQNQSLTGQLQQLFDCAEQNNASLIRMRAAIATAEAGEETARLAQLPDVEAQLSISYLGDARLWNRTFGESMAAPMPHFGNNFLLRAEQVVYSGGAITCGIRLAEQQTKMLRLSADEQRQRVRFLLVGLYLQLHSLRHQETVYATNRELALRQIELMNHRREQGVSLRNDITRYELQLQQIALGQTTVSDRQSVLTKQLRTALGTDSVPLAMLSDDAFEGVGMAVVSVEDWLR
uniref:TolC family protein n=1 Tax=Prevotella sp. TaxID=59823 RepID=UPI003FF0F931